MPLAKQHWLPFPISKNVSDNPLDIVHCDIWGPLHVDSHNGYIYFLTLVDDCTRFTWIFLLKNKSDVHRVILHICTMVENHLSRNIKIFRFDNAKELLFADFLSKK